METSENVMERVRPCIEIWKGMELGSTMSPPTILSVMPRLLSRSGMCTRSTGNGPLRPAEAAATRRRTEAKRSMMVTR